MCKSWTKQIVKAVSKGNCLKGTGIQMSKVRAPVGPHEDTVVMGELLNKMVQANLQ